MRNAKRVISILMAVLLCVASFAGCGKNDNNSSSSTLPSGSSAPDLQTRVLKVAALESAYGQEVWKQVGAAFETLMPDVKVELTMDKSIEDVIGPAMKAGDYPDVVHLGTGRPAGMTETFVRENNMVELTDVFSMTIPGESIMVKDKLAPGFLENSIISPYGDQKSYMAPMFYGPCGLFYNAGLFRAKGWTVPETWDEMWALGETAKAEGISLFTYPTTGYFDAFFYALLHGTGGPEFFNKAMRYEEGIWATPEATQAFDIVGKMATYTHPTTPANANNDNFQKNQQLILDNKALFMPNGSWVIGEMRDAPRAEGFEWGFTALPAMVKGGDRYSYTFFEQAWIPQGAENVDLAKQFIAFLYSDVAADIFATVGAIQPIKGISSRLEGDMKLYYGIYENGAKPAMGSFAATNPVEGVNMADTLFGTVNSLVSGNKTQQQWMEEITKSSDALRAALKK